MPRYNDALAQERLDAETQKLSQGERRLSIQQEANLLERAKMVEAMAVARFKIETARREAVATAMATKDFINIDPQSPEFPKQRAEIVAKYAADASGSRVFQESLSRLDTQRTNFIAAQQILDRQREEDAAKSALEQGKAFAPANIGKAGYDLNTTMAGFNTLAKQLDKTNPDGAKKLRDAAAIYADYATAVGKKALDTIGAPTVPATAVQPTAPAATPTPTPAATPTPAPVTTAPTPAPASTAITSPAAIATQNASAFLASALGQTTPAPSAPPVQAATSGLPDAADAATKPDEETP